MSHYTSNSPQPDATLPVTIVGGYLGSGKTTLINHLLNNAGDHRYAVLVNDFGELAIDAQLIKSQNGNVISLSGGCVCCSYGNDLTGALMELDTSAIDQVVIEASGVALPGSIAGTLSLLQDYAPGSVMVLADSGTIESYAGDKYLADTIDRQLASADIIAVNKIDLISDKQKQRIGNWLENDYPSARIINVSHADYPLELFRMDTPQAVTERHAHISSTDSHQISMYTTFVLKLAGEYNTDQLAHSLTDKDLGLLRAKGFVSDADGTMRTIQIVGTRSSLHPAPPNVTAGLVCIGLSDQCSEERVNSVVGKARETLAVSNNEFL